jgi:hypothetical protein
MNRWRLRDGGNAADEIHRAGNEYATYLWEGVDGRLIASDGASAEMGEPLILGDNIKEFSAEQSEAEGDAEIEVKGQRTKRGSWGKEAINKKVKLKDKWRKDATLLSIPFQGDATDEALERRAKFEADDRASAMKKCQITVHHVQSRTGAPWDIGMLHYVEIPPEGIYEVMECTALVYEVTADKLETRMELSAAPSGGVEGGIGDLAEAAGLGGVTGGVRGVGGIGQIGGIAASVGSAIGGVGDILASGANFASRATGIVLGALRRAHAGFQYVEGQYPRQWGPAQLSIVRQSADGLDVVPDNELMPIPAKRPPLRLPDGLKDIAE